MNFCKKYSFLLIFISTLLSLAQNSFANSLHAPTYAVTYDEPTGILVNVSLPFADALDFRNRHVYCFIKEDGSMATTIADSLQFWNDATSSYSLSLRDFLLAPGYVGNYGDYEIRVPFDGYPSSCYSDNSAGYALIHYTSSGISTDMSPNTIRTQLSNSTESEDDSIQNSTGIADQTQFRFGVTYTNFDNLAPDYIRLVVGKIDTNGVSTSTLDLHSNGNNYASGTQFALQVTFSKGYYTYYIESKNGSEIEHTPEGSFVISEANATSTPRYYINIDKETGIITNGNMPNANHPDIFGNSYYCISGISGQNTTGSIIHSPFGTAAVISNGIPMYNSNDLPNYFWSLVKGAYGDYEIRMPAGDYYAGCSTDNSNGYALVHYTPNGWFNDIDFPIKRNPVIIIPGIMSSYLNKDDGTEVWLNLKKALLPFGDTYLDDLMMDESGNFDISRPSLFTPDIFRKIRDKDFFDGLIKQLEQDGYVENEDLFVFPYDWRLDIRDDMSPLKTKIDSILNQTDSSKVDIIAHSMGGLIAKEYIKDYGLGEVDKFIDIATPHFGAPSSAQVLLSGDDLGIKYGLLGLNFGEVKKISQNMSSVYQLLPSPVYFSDNLPDYKYYIDDMSDFDNDGVKDRLSYDQSNQFLKNTGRNSYVLDHAVDIHTTLDTLNPMDYGVQTYNIVGCGTYTMGKIFTLGKETDKDPEFDVIQISGDGTVPQRSAEGIMSQEQYYDIGAEHATMPSQAGVKELISSLLLGTQSSFDFTEHTNISTSSDKCKLPAGKLVSFHSPVDVHIYDENGNHTGPDANGDIEYGISGVTYDIFENNKFIFLPEGHIYQIKLNATDIGSFSVHVKDMKDGSILSTQYFSDIPLISTSTRAEVSITASTTEILLDPNGDTTNIQIFKPSSLVEGDSLDDRIPPTTNIQISSGQISFEATDTESGVLKTKYSFDGDTWIDYIDPITTQQKTIQYFSIDKAGNIEPIQLKTISLEIQGGIIATQVVISHSSGSLIQISSTSASQDFPEKKISTSSNPVKVLSIDKPNNLKKAPNKDQVLPVKGNAPKIEPANKKVTSIKENNLASVGSVDVQVYVYQLFKYIQSTFKEGISFVRRLIRM